VTATAEHLTAREAFLTRPPTAQWTMVATCPTCGGPFTPVADGAPDPMRLTAMVACKPCRQQWQVQVTLHMAFTSLAAVRHLPGEPIICGSEAGYRKHRRNGEPTCAACRKAHSLEVTMRKHRRESRRAV
jgi:hypothetical protein